MASDLENFLASLRFVDGADKWRGPDTDALARLAGGDLARAEEAIIESLERGDYWEGVTCIYARPADAFIPVVERIVANANSSGRSLNGEYAIELAHWLWERGRYPRLEAYIKEVATWPDADRLFPQTAVATRIAQFPSGENAGLLLDLMVDSPHDAVRQRAMWSLLVMAGVVKHPLEALERPDELHWARVLGHELSSKLSADRPERLREVREKLLGKLDELGRRLPA